MRRLRARAAAAPAVVTLGGAAGAGLRELAVSAVPGHPLAVTMSINLAGSFALGLLLSWRAGGVDGPRVRLLRLGLGTGLCGGFTTYSALAVQVAGLGVDGDGVTAGTYAVATLFLGALATLAGVLLAPGPRARPTPRSPGGGEAR